MDSNPRSGGGERKPYRAPQLTRQKNLKDITLFTDFTPPGSKPADGSGLDLKDG